MADSEDFYKEHQEYWHKYIYYLLTVTGAAIVYTLNKLEGRQFEPSLVLLIIAIVFWIVSFFCGVKILKHALRQIGVKSAISIINRTIDQNLQGDESFKKLTVDTFSLENKNPDRLANIYYSRQFICLLLGTVFYALWVIVEMDLRTYCCSC